MSVDPRVRQIKIKTGVVSRITKEKISYEKETETEKNRLEKFRTQGDDENTLRKQEEVIQESFSMISDCKKRLKTAVADLQNVLETEKDLAEEDDYKKAEAAITAAQDHMN